MKEGEVLFRVNVVGAGICGLTVAQALIEKYGKKVDVTITAHKFYEQTTSFAAGGLWEPHLLGDTPSDLVLRWSEASYLYYQALYFGPNAGVAGIQQIKVHNLYSETDNDGKIIPDPVWSYIPAVEFSSLSQQQLTDMGYSSKYTYGHSFTSFVADPRYFLAFLGESLRNIGVHFEEKRVDIIEHQFHEKSPSGDAKYDIVLNCTGLGAYYTAKDTSIFPIRGQVLRVYAPWIKSSCTFGSNYVIPNIDSLVIGGTTQKGDWNTNESTEDTKAILEGVCEMFPSLRCAKILGVYVGLRPCRSSVCLYSRLVNLISKKGSSQKQGLLVHCYGLGGSGFTIGPGLARDVVDKHIQPFVSKAVPLLKIVSRL